ncbi:MAG TPA: S9 family peptidase, partial [Novosphingobium sp.]|nr:S9 family peptidase [Novosphingobium sp.]
MQALHYPVTRREGLEETHFGVSIADPYRWLENDVRSDPAVADWVKAQNAASSAYLDGLPARQWFRERITQLSNFERYSLPQKAGGRYFFTRNSGLMNQPQLLVRDLHGGADGGRDRLLLDPNHWSADGATALDGWEPSHDGRRLLYSVQEAGSDWRVLRVIDVASARPLADEIRWVKESGLAWVGNSGFLYSRFPEPAKGQAFQDRNYNHAVWYHRIGTPQSADELVYATPAHPEYNHYAEVTGDGRYAVITSAIGTDARYEVHVIDLMHRHGQWPVQALVTGFGNDWRLVDSIGTRLWFVTNWQAARRRLVMVDLGATDRQWREVVPEGKATLEQATIIGDRLVLTLLQDAVSRAMIFPLRGGMPEELSLNGIGAASGFRGHAGDPETFYSFASFNQPASIYRLNIATGQSEVFAQPKLNFRPDDFLVEQHFYTSKDGTRIPMFVVRAREAAQKHQALPTLLYGYGGF